jgi:hypothetical protein
MTDLVIPMTGNAEYDALPAGVKLQLTLREYLWMNDVDKSRLVQQSTEPEWDE